jgi:hypothetical protein
MNAIVHLCFISGLVAAIIGLRTIKTKHWVDISKYSLESIEYEGNSAILTGAFFLFIGIVLLVLGIIALLIK